MLVSTLKPSQECLTRTVREVTAKSKGIPTVEVFDIDMTPCPIWDVRDMGS